ncbi:hypothetical protein L873DRAFT_1037629 [Choiromyces venosus 120613-1]|uniref:Uncharacterized protein n=1 Tax=Choiromyces venosus 120613-1 TaxID=1336337 RepID=A0A3N4JJD6_9PEZI|nr:hypothetical protein L873DRAFT_1037629 [Choiromyces venosus 120613-1]
MYDILLMKVEGFTAINIVYFFLSCLSQPLYILGVSPFPFFCYGGVRGRLCKAGIAYLGVLLVSLLFQLILFIRSIRR